MPTPEGINIQESANSLTISYKWNKLNGYIMFAFSFIWNGAMAGIFLNTIWIPFLAFALMIPGFYMFYYGLRNILNSTFLTVDSNGLTVKDMPISPRNEKMIPKQDIRQLYVKRTERYSKGQTYYIYSIHIIDKGHKDIKLISIEHGIEGLEGDANDHLKFIEKKIEAFLKIEDSPMAGEYQS